MLPDFAKGEPGWEAVFGVAIFGISLVVALIVWFTFNKVLTRITARTGTALDDLMVKAIGGPLFIFVLVFGPYTALTATTYLDEYQGQLDRGLVSAEIVIACYAVKRIVAALPDLVRQGGGAQDDRQLGRTGTAQCEDGSPTSLILSVAAPPGAAGAGPEHQSPTGGSGHRRPGGGAGDSADPLQPVCWHLHGDGESYRRRAITSRWMADHPAGWKRWDGGRPRSGTSSTT